MFEDKFTNLIFEAVIHIAKLDYPEKWDNLINDCMNQLTDGNHQLNLRIWKLINKYNHLINSYIKTS